MAPPGERSPDCSILFEGRELPAVAGEPVAVALFAAGTRVLSRSIKYHRPRSFFCLAGHCGACLMRVDGVPNVKSCRTPAREGLAVERQNAFPSASHDVLGAADWFFPKGMDHHTLLTSSRALNAVMRRVVREIGGLGRLPDERPDERPDEGVPETNARAIHSECDVAIVGGGPAGLAAAIAIARSREGARVLLFDEGDEPGGSLASHPAHGLPAARRLADEARACGVAIHPRAAAFGFYPEDGPADDQFGEGVLAVDDGGVLHTVRAHRYVYATGGYDVNALFGDNDRPGVCAARAAGRLFVAHGVRPGSRPIVLGRGEYADSLASALAGAGCEVTRVDGVEERAVAAIGHTSISALVVEQGGERRRIPCDLIAVAVDPPAPASELVRMHGGTVAFSPEGGGFAAVTDQSGRTTVPSVFACGDVCGYRGVEASRAHGERVGRAVAESLAWR